jgi:hypothetical protein
VRSTEEKIIQNLRSRGPIEFPVALIAAHPDDETIGAGGSLHLFANLTIVLTTHGAPRNLDYARRNGFDDNEAYVGSPQSGASERSCHKLRQLQPDRVWGKRPGGERRDGELGPTPGSPLSEPAIRRDHNAPIRRPWDEEQGVR